jgi:hypothetical protein
MLAFVWGTINLWGWLDSVDVSDAESQQWTFGQVIAIALLIVPVIALTEGYFRRESNLVIR